MDEEIKSDELYHHGVMGQKWGVTNGPPYPLTRLPLGEQQRIRKKRQLQLQNAKIRKKNSELRKKNKEKAEIEKLKERQREMKREQAELKRGSKPKKSSAASSGETTIKTENGDVKIKTALSKKDIRKMSNDEIKAYIDRLELEKKLYNLDNESVTNGKREVSKFLSEVGKKSLTNVATKAVTGIGTMAVKKVITNISGDPALAAEIMGGKEKKEDKKDKD